MHDRVTICSVIQRLLHWLESTPGYWRVVGKGLWCLALSLICYRLARLAGGVHYAMPTFTFDNLVANPFAFCAHLVVSPLAFIVQPLLYIYAVIYLLDAAVQSVKISLFLFFGRSLPS